MGDVGNMGIGLVLAEQIIVAAKQTATQRGWQMSFAVADSAGNLVALARKDDARWSTKGLA